MTATRYTAFTEPWRRTSWKRRYGYYRLMRLQRNGMVREYRTGSLQYLVSLMQRPSDSGQIARAWIELSTEPAWRPALSARAERYRRTGT